MVMLLPMDAICWKTTVAQNPNGPARRRLNHQAFRKQQQLFLR